MGKPLISVANPAVMNNHQHEFLEALEELGLVTYCRNLEDLPALILRHQRISRRLETDSQLANELMARIAALPCQPRRKNSWLRRLAQNFLARCAIDVADVLRQQVSQELPWELLIDPRSGDHVTRS
jgi:hypothetical protein